MELSLLLDPRALGAYHASLVDVARAELAAVLPDMPAEAVQRGPMRFLTLTASADRARTLSRLSSCHGLFEGHPNGSLAILDAEPGFSLPEGLVWGAKYKGKTHELVTQLALNVALATARTGSDDPVLLDPMAGRGTTLLWAARYGLAAWGIEQDAAALDHLQRHLGRQAKLHRFKHSVQRGVVGKRGKKGQGSFLDATLGPERTRLRLVPLVDYGSSAAAPEQRPRSGPAPSGAEAPVPSLRQAGDEPPP